MFSAQLKADKCINKVSAIIQSGRWRQPCDPSFTLRGSFLLPLTLQQVKTPHCCENKRRKVKSTIKACSLLSAFLLEVDVQGRSLSLSLLYHFTLLSGNMHSCCQFQLYLHCSNFIETSPLCFHLANVITWSGRCCGHILNVVVHPITNQVYFHVLSCLSQEASLRLADINVT